MSDESGQIVAADSGELIYGSISLFNFRTTGAELQRLQAFLPLGISIFQL